MASIKILLRADKLNKKTGEAPLYLRIIKDRKPRYYALGVKLKPEQWDEEASKVRKNHPNSKRLNYFLTTKKAEAEGTVIDMELTAPNANTKKIKNKILGLDSVSWFMVAQKEINRLRNNKQFGTATTLETTSRKMNTYLEDKDLKLRQIDVKWIKGFEAWIRNELGNQDSTVYNNLKNIRKVINIAIQEDLFPMDKSPFLKIRLKQGKSSRDYLTEVQLELLENLKLEAGSRRELCRDLYVFACYAGGIRVSDLLSLRWHQYDGERLVFKMIKTADGVSVKLPRKAREILESFRGEDVQPNGFIFPFLPVDYDQLAEEKQYSLLRRKNGKINIQLKKLAEAIGLSHNMTIHTSRHTWATRALRKGMRIEYVSKLMGHTDITTTQPYAKIVNAELDAAMDVFDE